MEINKIMYNSVMTGPYGDKKKGFIYEYHHGLLSDICTAIFNVFRKCTIITPSKILWVDLYANYMKTDLGQTRTVKSLI